jgi:hypothetical protein
MERMESAGIDLGPIYGDSNKLVDLVVSIVKGNSEEIAENLPSVTDQIIHEHEEMAEKLALVLYVLAGISLVGLFLNFKNHAKANVVSYFAFAIALVAVFLGKQTGTTGGEVRHTEIRANATTGIPSKSNTTEETDED